MRVAILAASLLLFSGASVSSAQDGDSSEAANLVKPAAVPFGVGEQLSYRVKFGPLEVGEAEMRLPAIDTIAGHPTYHLRFTIKGGIPFYKLEDTQESWLDVYELASRRFIQDLQEGDYERYRVYEIDLEERRYTTNEGTTDSVPSGALDDASFVYFVRTIPLEVGETYEWNRYFRYDRNPVVLKVLRREEVEVPAGKFKTVVVRPIIKAGGIYGEGGEAEIYMTDDARRIPVLLRSKLKVGRLSMELTEYEPGTPLTSRVLQGPEPPSSGSEPSRP